MNREIPMALREVRKPNMSINKLGEFLTTNPQRQRRILEQLKYPNESRYGATAYQSSRNIIKRYFIEGFDEQILLKGIETLKRKKPENEYQVGMVNSEIEALEKVQKTNCIEQERYSYEIYSGNNPKLDIHGVKVSVYPDLIVRQQFRGKSFVGGLKIHLSKTNSIEEEGSGYISTILCKFVEEEIAKEDEVSKNRLNISYDVFNDNFITCPASVQRRWDHINAACQNIIAIWDSI
ncbi:MAG: hypothetical protein AAF824_10420 [Bacteroidota bacterium]